MQTNSTEDTATAIQEPYLGRTCRKYDRNVNSSTIAATENRTTQNAIEGEYEIDFCWIGSVLLCETHPNGPGNNPD